MIGDVLLLAMLLGVAVWHSIAFGYDAGFKAGQREANNADAEQSG